MSPPACRSNRAAALQCVGEALCRRAKLSQWTCVCMPNHCCPVLCCDVGCCCVAPAGPAVSGVGVELVSALQHLTGHTEQLKEASREARAAAEAAEAAAADAVAQRRAATAQVQELEEVYRELQDAYLELQQKHGTLKVRVCLCMYVCPRCWGSRKGCWAQSSSQGSCCTL